MPSNPLEDALTDAISVAVDDLAYRISYEKTRLVPDAESIASWQAQYDALEHLEDTMFTTYTVIGDTNTTNGLPCVIATLKGTQNVIREEDTTTWVEVVTADNIDEARRAALTAHGAPKVPSAGR